ncbi:hypothetical protein BsWGS_07739 [Bradybaena similaris]
MYANGSLPIGSFHRTEQHRRIHAFSVVRFPPSSKFQGTSKPAEVYCWNLTSVILLFGKTARFGTVD